MKFMVFNSLLKSTCFLSHYKSSVRPLWKCQGTETMFFKFLHLMYPIIDFNVKLRETASFCIVQKSSVYNKHELILILNSVLVSLWKVPKSNVRWNSKNQYTAQYRFLHPIEIIGSTIFDLPFQLSFSNSWSALSWIQKSIIRYYSM